MSNIQDIIPDIRQRIWKIFDLVREMSRELPWLALCLNHFEVTNIGANHDLMMLFEEPVLEPDIL